MKRKCVIFGTTDFGKMLRYYFEKYADVQIVAYTVDKAYPGSLRRPHQLPGYPGGEHLALPLRQGHQAEGPPDRQTVRRTG